MLSKLNNRKGFTLVELLIVVAIVGILATVGIPGYQRMVQKSRQSEAKVNLGNVSLVESSFFSEYGTYGNNLASMGFEADNEATMRYVIGFTTATCVDMTGRVAGAGLRPDPLVPLLVPATCTGGSAFANAICAGNSTYYIGTPANVEIRGTFGFNNGLAPAVAPAASNFGLGRGANACQLAVQPTIGPPATYTAAASGTIAPGWLPTGAGAGSPLDGWTINEQKTMVNVVSGIR